MFDHEFPPSIVPAIIILALVILRVRSFYKLRDYLQLGRAFTELTLGIIYLVDSLYTFTVIDRVVLIRNSIIIIFASELFYQAYILPKMRRVAKDGTK